MALGGRSPVAVRFAARFPDRVRRLYLQGITVGENAAAGRPLLRPTARHLAMEDWQLYLETVASRVLGSEAHVAAYVERMTKCSDRANLFAALDALDAEDTAEDVRALQCPTLVAEVEGYTLIESGQTERFVTLAPGAQVRYLPNRPGWLADFVAAIEDFETELDRPAVPGVQLSPRETEVLTLLASGHTNSEIASALNLSRSTVDRHIANIYAKLNVRNRAEATRWALTHGLDLAT
jgi:DNA-binding CsgD family transcriptional regulator